MQLVYRYR